MRAGHAPDSTGPGDWTVMLLELQKWKRSTAKKATKDELGNSSPPLLLEKFQALEPENADRPCRQAQRQVVGM